MKTWMLIVAGGLTLLSVAGCKSEDDTKMSFDELHQSLAKGRDSMGKGAPGPAKQLAPQDQARANMSLQGVPPEIRNKVQQNMGGG